MSPSYEKQLRKLKIGDPVDLEALRKHGFTGFDSATDARITEWGNYRRIEFFDAKGTWLGWHRLDHQVYWDGELILGWTLMIGGAGAVIALLYWLIRKVWR